AVPWIIKVAIDGPISDGNPRGLIPLFLLAVALGCIEIGLTFWRRRAMSDVALRMETALRDDLYEHLQRLDVGFHDQWQSGQLLSRAQSDLTTIRRFAAFGAIFFAVLCPTI